MRDRLTKRDRYGHAYTNETIHDRGMTSKDGVHFEKHYFENGTSAYDGKPIDVLCDLEDKIEHGKIVELPCKVGDKAAVRALCECVLVNHCFEECRNICPFEDDCDCDDCADCNERIFDTKVSAIYNNGNGWYIEFEHLIIQARFSDIGTSFFIGENSHEQAVAYEKALAERREG